ncbi:MAG: DUF6527 family protein [Gammaproteobacteria bacterium]|nr:DUF6527 family protein [Gammaproteobacteria bacterium]
MKTKHWEIAWVEDMPSIIQPHTFYISMQHRLTEHLCACGCGTEVSLPLGPSEWRIEGEEAGISLHPSVGNWRLPCKSHYVIHNSTTHWRETWTAQQISAGRARDQNAKNREIAANRRLMPWWLRIWYWFCRLVRR